MRTAAVVGFLVASHAAVALACSCVSGLTLLWPVDGATVPPNARVFVGDRLTLQWSPDENRPPRLFDAQGVPVPTVDSVIETGFGNLSVLTPQAPLAVGAYEVKSGENRITAFTVSGPALSGVPEIPTVLATDGTNYQGMGGGDCGDSLWARWELAASGAILLVDRDGTTTFDPETLSGRVASTHHVNPQGASAASLGKGGCGGNWSEASAGAETRARFGVLDAAGHFSGWSEPQLGEVPLFGCSCGAGGSSLLLLGVGLAAMLRRMRRAR